MGQEIKITVSRIPSFIIAELEKHVAELHDEYDLDSDHIHTLQALIVGYEAAWDAMEETNRHPRPIDEWHEEIGDVLWWTFPVQEPPYCGTPIDDNWPDYHTHWTPIIAPEKPNKQTDSFE